MSVSAESPFANSTVSWSLRAKIALAVTLPILLILVFLSLIHYKREQRLLEEQLELSAQQLGEVVLGSLQHTMLLNDNKMLSEVLNDLVGEEENVLQIEIIDLGGIVRRSTNETLLGQKQSLETGGCKECHQFPPPDRPRATHLAAANEILRITTPIDNKPGCSSCHTDQDAHLGVLLIDASLLDINKHVLSDLRVDLSISLAGTLLVSLAAYGLIHLLVVKRVESYQQPLIQFAAGDLTARLPSPEKATDELDELAQTFNTMVRDLERHALELEERSQVRQRAIVEERERIARELHDGMAQLLGYVNTKAMAVRLLLIDRKVIAAREQLQQLEAAARELYTDVREAILGLKLSSLNGEGFPSTVQDFADKFSRLSGIPVDVRITPRFRDIALPPETELQLLRIIQEALSNVRKHSHASEAWIHLGLKEGRLQLTIEDNGMGFDPEQPHPDRRPRFGLSTMKERAEAIGAAFQLDTEPAGGTRITIEISVEEI